ncbi:chemotaxis protein CheB [Nitrosococcus oceani]|uniref:chemotaxis protein CheB n=1 Tax=Nitrosococcus oceani TaxID=1229 RepID=UPI0004E96EB5|nr:chemotaxis protein CheB [Nitrosococcus oceani]KFI22737.1 chemotaxis protein CheY [Nitrosococcus oceani]
MRLKKPDSPPFSIVGIGASAGGIEALQTFFEALPEEPGVAFVVIIHLDPEQSSELAPILARKTPMPVEEVQGNCALEPNHIYVISPNQQLELTDSHIGAFPFEQPRGQRAPIDTFFRSLAKQYGDGFAIILSGSGSDGAVGVKAIKEQGGLILVQLPTEARFDGMPRAAIATGMVDFVLPTRELAQRLPELIEGRRHIYEKLADETQIQDRDSLLKSIFAHLQRKVGYDFSKYKRPTILRRLARRMQIQHQQTLNDYLNFLRQNPEESRALFEELLISVTTFFRDPEAWETLRTQLIPRLFEEKAPDTPLRIWVPGCATGEEAYTLAILLLEEAERRGVPPDIQIFATDLDEGALATARAGYYPSAIQADLSDERLRRYFRVEGNHYRLTGEVRNCVLFAIHSLLQDPPFSHLDLISCRNLLIYLDRDLQNQVFAIMHYGLRRGGYLFLGASENAEGENFRAIERSHRLFQARQTLGQRPPIPLLLAAPGRSRTLIPSPASSTTPARIHRQLLEKLAPPSLLVDEHHQVIHLSNAVGRFLQPAGGPPSQEITTLVRPALQAALSMALYHAFEHNKPSLSPFTPVPFNGTPRQVAVLVQPRPTAADQEKIALVIFLEGDKEPPPVEQNLSEETASLPMVHRLQEELRQARAQLLTRQEQAETSSQDLRVANEELQSINEEYRSTAEELETSQEELQSINEELQTVNNELKTKLEETSRSRNDLENLLAATEIGTLFLDRQLNIHRFTPPVTKLFPITTHDYGRPITDFTDRLAYDQLEADAHHVLHTLIPIERELRHQQGRWYLARIYPYRNPEERIVGLIVTFMDISHRKENEERQQQLAQKLAQQTKQLQEQDRQKDQFLALLGHELRNPLAVIFNTTELLIRENGATRHVQHGIALISRQAKHLGRLVDDLLNLTRINSGQIKLSKTTLELQDSITSAIDQTRPQIEWGRHQLTVDLPASPLYLEADSERLTQIIANLLSNAAHYTKPGGKITVTARQVEEQILIQVRDTGIGFAPEQLPQLFKPFERLPSATAHHRSGLGLGLNLARRLAELHQGSLEGFSAGPGQGSEFTLRLPALPGEQTGPPTPQELLPEAETTIPPRRILLVEDDEAVADSLAMLLRLQGHEVQTIFRGNQTFNAVLKFHPEVVLLDIGLPDMDGYQVAQRLRQEPGLETLPLVALTGYGQKDDVQRAKAAGFNRHLLKPATIDTLQKLLGEL